MKSGIFKVFATLVFLLTTSIAALACPVCERQQPEVLKGISHGAGPSGNWDYVIIGVAVVIVLATLYYTVKWIVKPGEKDPAHIKRTIFKFS